MRNLFKVFISLFLAATFLNANSLNEKFEVDGYSVKLVSKRDLSVGSNEFFTKITKDGKIVEDAQLRVKFFMPEMPGMPYMDHDGEGVFESNQYKFIINFCMDGTWQYNLRFKTSDDKVHSIKSSVSF
ncbi:FixH family protein [Aliarcobacter lanthieri]|uniref:FixH family protein n=1 Tax=Aliarcobacter lanthieri TaxID=1355374 RepID=UPI003AA86841